MVFSKNVGRVVGGPGNESRYELEKPLIRWSLMFIFTAEYHCTGGVWPLSFNSDRGLSVLIPNSTL